MIPRHVETIFCDDIRHEIGGKISLIGVYSEWMFVSAFPVTIPKLCLLVKVITPAEEPLRSVSLRVLRDEDVLQELVLEKEQFEAASDLVGEMPDDEKRQRAHLVQFVLVFSPLHLEGPATLRALVETEDGELRGLALRVGQGPHPNDLILGGEKSHPPS